MMMFDRLNLSIRSEKLNKAVLSGRFEGVVPVLAAMSDEDTDRLEHIAEPCTATKLLRTNNRHIARCNILTRLR